jgi:23S rRNA pseudouridine1911/1915/1917 synthase
MNKFRVNKKDKGLRLDQFIHHRLGAEISIKKIKYAIEKGQCQVNEKIDFRPHYKCRVSDLINFISKDEENENKKCLTLWEDEALIAIEKPPGLSSAAAEEVLGNGVALVHRLDKLTSGILLMAKNPEARKMAEDLFKHHLMKKEYMALVQGGWRKEKGIIQTAHGPKGKRRGLKIWGSVADGGQEAITEYEIIKKDDEVAFVKFKPKTGRTHQLRCHSSEGGHPILGDNLYGIKLTGKVLTQRLMLHASQMEFKHPLSAKAIKIQSALPQAFIQIFKNRKELKSLVSLYSTGS